MKLRMQDGMELEFYQWLPQTAEVKGIVQLVHGSCEHARRYKQFAEFLNEHGYIIYANDHRGHGNSVECFEDLGYFGEVAGWQRMVDDLFELNSFIRKNYPQLPIVMLGHSMGSFLARHYAIDYGETISGLILSGTAHNPKSILKFGKSTANILRKIQGPKHRSNLINALSYDAFNKPFKHARTTHEWLSADPNVVDEFLADEACGFVFTTTGFRDMFEGLLYITNQDNINKMPKDLSVALISGQLDPVGANGKMVKKAFEAFEEAGLTHIEMKLYPEMRHEILNEIDKQTVYLDVLTYLNNIQRKKTI
ncbi:MAG TPA: alpha/beta hydrolase [Firmicutes bacterium]|nr:alpha/beta hydrolase [Bacillota bacterium]